MLVVDGKELDPRNAFTIIDNSAKDVVDSKGALETNGSLFTGVDAKVLNPREAPNNMGNTSKMASVKSSSPGKP